MLKRKKPSHREVTLRKLKGILPSERSQSEKATYCTTPTIHHSGKGKIMETINRLLVVRDGGTER